MSDTFSPRRIWLVLKRDIMESWRSHLWAALGLYAIALLFMFSIMSGTAGSMADGSESFDEFKEEVGVILQLILLMAFFVYASMIMKPMATKEKCISFLMLPASRLEKFAARFLFVTVGCLLLVFIAVLAADLTRILVFVPVLHIDKVFYRPVFTTLWSLSVKANIGPSELSYIIMGVNPLDLICKVFTQSFFMLCGCIWRKNAFFKALAIMVAVPVVTLTLAAFYLDYSSSLLCWLLERPSMDAIILTAKVVLLLLTLLFWYLSYVKFTRKQIVSH